MTAPKEILRLVEIFESNIETYKTSQLYNEAQLRREFIDPFFDALGWDITNKQGFAPAYREVINEDAIKVGSATKAPDYCFRIGSTRKFFVEAKKPAADIKNDSEPAYQLRRYAWSAKLPLSILTNFEEFAVYDCQVRPNVNDKPSTARIFFCGYKEYGDKWEQIANIFSKESVLKGLFDKYASEKTTKRGTTTVDKEFLAEIEEWRNELAKNIAIRNSKLSVYDLNFAVQKTIDRILFLRICEDRGIERSKQLLGLINGNRIYPRLFELFEKADEKYNSGIFHFRREKDRPESPDEMSANLKVDDDVLKKIIKDLYYPCPYEFSIMPAEILGNVYEQFLGKVIRLTASHQAKVEEKPEVKKAGGVYYTPSYIVDYIVKNTVGKLCEDKTPKQIEKIKILDPACGSGSFLIGAYQYLLDYHRDYYVKESAKHRKQVYQGKGGLWFLTIDEKKRILLNNIYGVDIDSQAAEVTKLSLLLKVLENETQESLRLFHERALPDLGNNIKCGNSLIGPDFYQNQQLNLFGDEQQRKINAFDWQAEFAEIFSGKNPGFDAVIGNPPWLMAGYYVSDELDYLRHTFGSAYGKFDLYYLFIEKGCQLFSEKGLFGMIVPNKFFHTKAAVNLRNFLSSSRLINSIVDFGDEQIFSGATNYSCMLFLQRGTKQNLTFAKAKKELRIYQELKISQSILASDSWHFEEQTTYELFEKIHKQGSFLQDVTSRFGTGVQTGADSIFTIDYSLVKTSKLETEILRPLLRGRDVRRYKTSDNPKFLIFPYKIQNTEFVILEESELKKYRKVYNLLCENKSKLAERIWFGKKAIDLSGEWYGVMYLDSCTSFALPHILTPSLSNRSNFSLGTDELFSTGTAGVTSIIPKKDIGENILYLLGLLNSKLISFYITSHSPIFSGGYYKFSAPYLKKIPIKRINFTDKSDTSNHDKMISFVEQMLELHKKISKIKNPDEKTRIQRQIDSTDRQIDQLVYKLYDLTPEEIAIVEAGNSC
jgi:type I restriction-modification system DNA methylase subunit